MTRRMDRQYSYLEILPVVWQSRAIDCNGKRVFARCILYGACSEKAPLYNLFIGIFSAVPVMNAVIFTVVPVPGSRLVLLYSVCPLT